MVRYRNNREGSGRLFFSRCLQFHAPDTGANATTGNGGGGATPAPTGTAAAPDVTSHPPATPWDTVNWDEVPEASRAVLRAAQADHQRVARENAALQQQTQTLQQQAQARPAPTPPAGTAPAAVDPVEANIRESLKKQGYNQAQIDAQAPALASVMGGLIPLFKQSVGADLAPLATTVIAQQNQNNFEQAAQSVHGQQLFADPEIAQQVWNTIGQQTAQGRTFDPEAILNYAKMIYFDRQQVAGQPAPAPLLQPSSSSFFPTVQQPAAPNRSTGFSFPGAVNIRPTVGGGPAAGAHAVNGDTQAALATTFTEMARITGVAPKAFPSNLAVRGGGATKK